MKCWHDKGRFLENSSNQLPKIDEFSRKGSMSTWKKINLMSFGKLFRDFPICVKSERGLDQSQYIDRK